jgi:hypothetical protein
MREMLNELVIIQFNSIQWFSQYLSFLINQDLVIMVAALRHLVHMIYIYR